MRPRARPRLPREGLRRLEALTRGARRRGHRGRPLLLVPLEGGARSLVAFRPLTLTKLRCTSACVHECHTFSPVISRHLSSSLVISRHLHMHMAATRVLDRVFRGDMFRWDACFPV